MLCGYACVHIRDVLLHVRYHTDTMPMCCGHARYWPLSEWALTRLMKGKIAPPWHHRHLNYLSALRISIKLEKYE